MATYRLHKELRITQKTQAKLKKEALDGFDERVLGLGDLAKPSIPIDCLAAVYDLGGFTNFCNQSDPQLAVPAYLSEFIPWVMKEIKTNCMDTKQDSTEYIKMFSPLPFFVKFMGDSLLVLQDYSEMTPLAIRNSIIGVRRTCLAYRHFWKERLSKKLVNAPETLRCGMARGLVYSVGDQCDFVGTCINMASRLQKLPGITFAFNRRGIDIETETQPFFKQIVTKRVTIRGIGDAELICCLKGEIDLLKSKDRKIYGDV